MVILCSGSRVKVKVAARSNVKKSEDHMSGITTDLTLKLGTYAGDAYARCLHSENLQLLSWMDLHNSLRFFKHRAVVDCRIRQREPRNVIQPKLC